MTPKCRRAYFFHLIEKKKNIEVYLPEMHLYFPCAHTPAHFLSEQVYIVLSLTLVELAKI